MERQCSKKNAAQIGEIRFAPRSFTSAGLTVSNAAAPGEAEHAKPREHHVIDGGLWHRPQKTTNFATWKGGGMDVQIRLTNLDSQDQRVKSCADTAAVFHGEQVKIERDRRRARCRRCIRQHLARTGKRCNEISSCAKAGIASEARTASAAKILATSCSLSCNGTVNLGRSP